MHIWHIAVKRRRFLVGRLAVKCALCIFLAGFRMAEIRSDLTCTRRAIICVLLLIAASRRVLRPFLVAAVWAAMIVVSTGPLLKLLKQCLGGRRAWAVAIVSFEREKR